MVDFTVEVCDPTSPDMEAVLSILRHGRGVTEVDDRMRDAAAALRITHDPTLLTAFALCASQQSRGPLSRFAADTITKFVESGGMTNFIPTKMEWWCVRDPRLSFATCMAIESISGKSLGVRSAPCVWWYLSSASNSSQTVESMQRFVSVSDLLQFMADSHPVFRAPNDDIGNRFKHMLLLLVVSMHTWTSQDYGQGAFYNACLLLLTRYRSAPACELLHAAVVANKELARTIRAHPEGLKFLEELRGSARAELTRYTLGMKAESVAPLLLCNTLIDANK